MFFFFFFVVIVVVVITVVVIVVIIDVLIVVLLVVDIDVVIIIVVIIVDVVVVFIVVVFVFIVIVIIIINRLEVSIQHSSEGFGGNVMVVTKISDIPAQSLQTNEKKTNSIALIALIVLAEAMTLPLCTLSEISFPH